MKIPKPILLGAGTFMAYWIWTDLFKEPIDLLIFMGIIVILDSIFSSTKGKQK